jgi:F-type H+-transporting ATPase subunit delta
MASHAHEDIQVARRYAKALFDLAMEKGAVETVEKDLLSIKELIDKSQDLRNAISSPVFSRDALTKAMEALLTKLGVGKIAYNFGLLLSQRRRLSLLPVIVGVFEERLREHRGELEAEVVSAVELTSAQEKEVVAALSASLNKTIRINRKVNPAIRGGLVIRMGSLMLDNSVESKLERLRQVSKRVVASM